MTVNIKLDKGLLKYPIFLKNLSAVCQIDIWERVNPRSICVKEQRNNPTTDIKYPTIGTLNFEL